MTVNRTRVTSAVAAATAILVLACSAGAGASSTTRATTTSRHPTPAMHDRDVLPPGEGGSLTPDKYSTDQIPLYNGLTPLGGNLTTADIKKYFKDDPLGDTVGRHEHVPIKGLTIIRDAYDVPHIYGSTRADAEFGAGWVAAEDRGLILQVIRTAGALAALDDPALHQGLPGAAPPGVLRRAPAGSAADPCR